jgi:hypothetical protein
VFEQLVDAKEVPLGLGVLRRHEGVGLVLEPGREQRREDDEHRQEEEPGDDLLEQVVRVERLRRAGGDGRRPGIGLLRVGETLLMDEDQVDGHDRPERQWQHEDVDAEESAERGLGDVDPTAKQVEEGISDHGHPAGDLGAHDRGPVGALVPGKQVAREPEGHRHPEQGHPDDPGQLARVLVGGLEEDPQEVEDQEQDHQVGGPVMDAADEPPERHVAGDEDDAVVGRLRGGLVVEGQQRPGDDLHAEEEQGHPAQEVGLRLEGDADVQEGVHQGVPVDTLLEPGVDPAGPGGWAVDGHLQALTM